MVSLVSLETATSACDALNKYVSKKVVEKQGEKESLFEQESWFELIVHLKEVKDKKSIIPVPVAIPHSLFSREDCQICLIVKCSEIDEIRQSLSEHPISNVKRIMTVTELRKDFKQFKDRRELVSSFDQFLADHRIMTCLGPILGKAFYEKRKNPCAVKLSAKNRIESIQKAMDSTFMIPGTAVFSIKVGKTSFPAKYVAENILSSLKTVIPKVGGISNIQSVALKTPDSISLPLFEHQLSVLIDELEQ